MYLKHGIQTYCKFVKKGKHFNILINFKQPTIYYVLSDEIHGYTPGGHLEDNKIYKVKLQLQLYFFVERLRPDVLRFQFICGSNIFKSIKYICDLTWRNCKGGECVVSH